VVVADGYNMTFTQRIIGLDVTFGNNTLTMTFMWWIYRHQCGVGSTVVIFPWRFQNKLSDHEDGIHRYGRSVSDSKMYVIRRT
jgi:hypothetical protein